LRVRHIDTDIIGVEASKTVARVVGCGVVFTATIAVQDGCRIIKLVYVHCGGTHIGRSM
jgi:hypothetical protein